MMQTDAARAAADRTLDRLDDAARDELEARAAPLERIARAGGHHEAGASLEDVVVAPQPLADVERATPQHEGARGVEHPGGDAAVDLVGRGIRCPLGAVARIEHRPFARLVARAGTEHPLVHALPVDAERMLEAHARRGREAVERHRHLEEDEGHGVRPSRARAARRARCRPRADG